MKGLMSTKKVFKALNAAGEALKLRISSLSCISSIGNNNTKLRIVRIATARRRRM
jgi:hypothetical protein